MSSLSKKTISISLISIVLWGTTPACQQNKALLFSEFGASASATENASPASVKLVAHLAELNGKTPQTVLIPKGTYHFHEDGAAERSYYISNHDQVNPKRVGLALENLKNVTIDGQGSQLVFHGRMVAISLINCENVTLKNFSIDFEPPHLRQLTAESFDKDHNALICRVTPEGDYEITNNKFIATGPGYQQPLFVAMAFDSVGHLAYRKADMDFGKAHLEEISPNILRMTGFEANPQNIGNRYVLRSYYRPNPGIFISKSTDTKLENIQIHYAEGMGLLAQMSENIHLDSFSVSLKKIDSRVFTTQADATHFSGCKGIIISENGVYEGMADDAINVHGTYLKMTNRTAPNKITARYMHNQAWGFTWGEVGDTIQLVESRRMEVVQSFNRIKSIKPIDQPTDDGAKEFEIELEQDLPAEVTNKASIGIENLTWTPQVIFRNNTIRNNRARGTLFSTPKRVVCEDNLFDHTHGTAILLCGDCNGWYETGACKEVIIRNNKFINSLTSYYQFTNAIISIYPEIPDLEGQKQYFHSGIIIENNLFETFDAPLLYAKSTDGITFRNNTIRTNNDYIPFHWNKHKFFFEHVKNIKIKNNIFERALEFDKDIRLNLTNAEEVVIE